jgi:hypothetical protein
MRLGIKFNRDARKIINGVSTKRCLLGIKPKEAKYEDEFVEDKKDNGLDFHSLNGVHPEARVEELEKDLREEKKQHHELSIKYDDMKADYERMKLEFEEYKKLNPPQPPKLKVKPAVKFIEDSDEEGSEIDTTESKIVLTIKPKK